MNEYETLEQTTEKNYRKFSKLEAGVKFQWLEEAMIFNYNLHQQNPRLKEISEYFRNREIEQQDSGSQ